MLILIFFFFIVYFWLIVMFCLHALVVNTREKCLASEKMWENFNVWFLYFPVWLVRNCGKILNLARYWKIEIKLLNEIL